MEISAAETQEGRNNEPSLGSFLSPRPFQGSLVPLDEDEREKAEFKATLDYFQGSSFLRALGFQELYLRTLYKACLIEFVGTAVFVYFHIAIILAGTINGSSYPPTAIAFLHTILLTVLILSFGRSSGAHFNSLISMSAIATRHMSFLRGLLYVCAQILGAIVGAMCMVRSINPSVAKSINLGGCHPGDKTAAQALVIEFFTSMLLLIPTYGVAFNEKQRAVYGPILPPFIIAAQVFVMIYSISALGEPPFTPGGFPNMCLGISIAYSDIVPTSEAFKMPWVYWLGAILAITINSILYGVAPPCHDEDETTRNVTKDEKK
jgi:glycerol uptake facilitator-like aquaporin